MDLVGREQIENKRANNDTSSFLKDLQHPKPIY